MPHGIRHGTFFPLSMDSRKHGTVWMLVKNMLPILFELSNPKTALMVEKLIFLAALIAVGYIVLMYSVSRNMLVSFGSNPSAMMSNAFSYPHFLVSPSVSGS